MTARQTLRTGLTLAGFILVLGFTLAGRPGGVAAGDLAAKDDPARWPLCYSDAVGWHVCTLDEIVSNFPAEFFEKAVDGRCPEGFVLDRRSGKCINDRLTVPDPVPASDERTAIVQTQATRLDPGGFGCPEGWIAVTPPLNPLLGCLPDTLVLEVIGEP